MDMLADTVLQSARNTAISCSPIVYLLVSLG